MTRQTQHPLQDERAASALSKRPPLVEIVSKPQRVVITEIRLSWGNIFDIMLKVSLLIIPLIIVLYYVFTTLAELLSSIAG